jgi:triphosphatase
MMDAVQPQNSDTLERELKFALESGDAAKLKEHRLLNWIKPNIKSTISTYFDTADHALGKAGLSLRLRAVEGQVIQTLKLPAARSSGFFARGEYEKEVAGDEPDLEHLRQYCPPALYKTLEFPLAAIFRVEVQKAEWSARWKQSLISLVLDEGFIRTELRDEPIEEVEIELRYGRIDDVFDFARQLAETVALRLEVMTKAERGYSLAADEGLQIEKAAAIKLDRESMAAAGFQTIASLCIHHFAANERVFLAASAPEALHQMRVAIRRLRSLMSFFDDMLSKVDVEPLRAEIGRLFKSLGTARDLDVLITSLQEQEGALSSAALGEIQRERNAAYMRLTALLTSRVFCLTMLDLLRLIECGAWMKAGQRACSGEKLNIRAALILKRQRKKLRKFKMVSHLEADKRHRLRIQAKKLRYACEFFGALFTSPKAHHRRRDMSEMAEELQDTLGQLNDRVFMQRKLAQWAGAARVPNVAWTDEKKPSDKDLIKAAESAQTQLLKEKRFWT